MLTQAELSNMVCHDCDCEGSVLWFHSRCHPKAPTWVRYHKDGLLLITCSECGHHIVTVLVAERQPQ